MERCGKRNASNAGAESWTEIGVVAGVGAVVLIMQWPYERNGDVTWESELLQRLQKVRANCKTRNQLKCIIDIIRNNDIMGGTQHYQNQGFLRRSDTDALLSRS